MATFAIPDGYELLNGEIFYLSPGESIVRPAIAGLLQNDPQLPADAVISIRSLNGESRVPATWSASGAEGIRGTISIGSAGEFSYTATKAVSGFEMFAYEVHSGGKSYFGLLEFVLIGVDPWGSAGKSNATTLTALHQPDFVAQKSVLGTAKIDTLILNSLTQEEQARLILARNGDQIQVALNEAAIVTNGVERFQFSTGTIAFDLDGHAGLVYRLYQAAFDRQPDAAGLSYWIGRLDIGAIMRDGVSESFLQSPEFIRTYGTAATVGDGAFIDLLYRHTLGRPPDQPGLEFWHNQLTAGHSTRSDLLTNFSESAENIARVAPAIADGIWLT